VTAVMDRRTTICILVGIPKAAGHNTTRLNADQIDGSFMTDRVQEKLENVVVQKKCSIRAAALSLLGSLSLLGCDALPVQPPHMVANAISIQAENVKEVSIRPQPITGDTVVCETFVPTGSHIRRRHCSTVRERDRTAAEAQEWFRSGGERGSFTLADPVSR